MAWETVNDEGQVVRQESSLDNFTAQGQTEGYGNAIWDQVVVPIGEKTPSASRGAVIGAGGALAADIIDPTPGINPMNIAGGGLAGAAVGAAVPYAYDAAEALSSPNSIMRGSTWDKAGEGLGIATGVTGEIDPGVADTFGTGNMGRVANVGNSVIEGVGNAALGARAGLNQLGADVYGLLGIDSLADRAQADANKYRKGQSKNSVMGAMGEEVAYDVGMGAGLSKAVDAGKMVGRGIKNVHFDEIIRKGSKVISGIADKYNTRGIAAAGDVDTIKTMEKIGQKSLAGADMFPGIQGLSDLVGSFSPKAKGTIANMWDNIAAYGGGTSASARKTIDVADTIADELSLNKFGKIRSSLSPTQAAEVSGDASKIIAEMIRVKSLGERTVQGAKGVGSLITTMPGAGATKLFGLGTGIFADSNDNTTTRPSTKSIGL